MAEGPVVHFFAEKLRNVLAGQPVDITFGIKRLKELGPSFSGVRISDVEAVGKQFRIHFEDGRIVLVHLLMWGTWRIYDAGEKWDKPESRARLIIRAPGTVAVAFSAPVIEVFENAEALVASRWGDSGADPLNPDYVPSEAARRIRREGSRPVGTVIMDQQVIAGVGNILRNEILFLSGIDPRRAVSSLEEGELMRILKWTRDLMERWLRNMGKEKNWLNVYQRSGQPCPRCGGTIEFFRQNDRVTYVCPACQR